MSGDQRFAVAPPAGPTAAAPDANAAKLHQAAQRFEAMFLGEMIRLSRPKPDPAGPFGAGQGEQVWGSFMDDALGEAMAAHGVADSTTAGGLTAAAAAPATESTMTFQNGVSLQSGQEFSFNYELGGVQKSVTLQVGSDQTGTVESVGSTGNNVTLALNVDQVSGENITGSQIAAAMNTALTGTWYNADGTASSTTASGFGVSGTAAGTSIGVAVSGATLTASALSNGGQDQIVSAAPPQTDYQTLLNQVNTAQQAVISASATFGASQNWIESQQTYINNLVTTLQNGVGNLVDATMSAESAQLTALQTQEQLGTSVLSIANQQPASILSLFR